MSYDLEHERILRQGVTREILEAVRKLRSTGVRLVFPESLHDSQTSWPPDCPLSESEMRAELESILAEARSIKSDLDALRARGRKILKDLPEEEAPDGYWGRPVSVYYALTDAIDCLCDDNCRSDLSLSFAERMAVATPESLRAEWLQRTFNNVLKKLDHPDTRDQLERVRAALFSEDAAKVRQEE